MNSLSPLLKDHRYQVGIIILILVLTISSWSYATRNIESTDNATVQCDLIDVVSEVNGVIEKIAFNDDQWIEKNQIAVNIEDSLFFSELKRAEASLEMESSNYNDTLNNLKVIEAELDANLDKAVLAHESARSTFDSMHAAIEEARQELRSIDKDMSYLEESLSKNSRLYKKKMVSELDYKNAKRQFESRHAIHASVKSKIDRLINLKDVEKSNVNQAKIELKTLEKTKENLRESALAKVETEKYRVEVAKAEYSLAQLNYSRTKIKAKREGYITNRRISSGDYIEVGQPIASIVSCQANPWIQANFKETQVGKMKEGQKVEFTIDTYPGVVFDGSLASISSGSGSTFSVLPPENATGNFTKVVKRMPVKISIVENKDIVLRIGTSANVKVFTD